MGYVLRHQPTGLFYAGKYYYATKVTNDPGEAYIFKTLRGAKIANDNRRLEDYFMTPVYINLSAESDKAFYSGLENKYMKENWKKKLSLEYRYKYSTAKVDKLKNNGWEYVDVDTLGDVVVDHEDLLFGGDLYLARDRSGEIAIYCGKPDKDEETGTFLVAGGRLAAGNLIILPPDTYPDITYDGSPKKLKSIKYDK